jgi:hypothetical protein
LFHLIQFITESVEKHGGNAPNPSVVHPFLSAPYNKDSDSGAGRPEHGCSDAISSTDKEKVLFRRAKQSSFYRT